MGNATLICDDDGSWSSDVPQCDESKYLNKVIILLAKFTFLFLVNQFVGSLFIVFQIGQL